MTLVQMTALVLESGSAAFVASGPGIGSWALAAALLTVGPWLSEAASAGLSTLAAAKSNGAGSVHALGDSCAD